MKYRFLYLITLCMLIVSCKSDIQGPLPYLGQKIEEEGEMKYHTIRPFSFIDQDSQTVSSQSLSKHVYLADFFFTSCPSICPKVTKEMLRLYEEFKDNESVKLISFTLDPKRDTPERLKTYATNLEVDSDSWLFLHGDKETVRNLANDFFVTAIDDEEVPGGINHSGQIILVDKDGHVRSFSNGTDPKETPGLIKDVYTLLNEK